MLFFWTFYLSNNPEKQNEAAQPFLLLVILTIVSEYIYIKGFIVRIFYNILLFAWWNKCSFDVLETKSKRPQTW